MRVAVAGDGGRIEQALRGAGATVTDPADAEVLVAVGERALLEAVRGETPPVLPVDAVGGGRSVRSAFDADLADGADSEDVAAALVGGAYRTVTRRRLSVRLGDDPVGSALLDVALMTSEPARISEYAVRVDGERVDEFRADGVVVAGVLGSGGYARRAGGPLLLPGAGSVIVPVSPFSTRADSWVAPPDAAVTLSVERDDGAVSLLLDDEVDRRVEPHRPVDIRPGEPVELVDLPNLDVGVGHPR